MGRRSPQRRGASPGGAIGRSIDHDGLLRRGGSRARTRQRANLTSLRKFEELVDGPLVVCVGAALRCQDAAVWRDKMVGRFSPEVAPFVGETSAPRGESADATRPRAWVEHGARAALDVELAVQGSRGVRNQFEG